MLAPRPEKIPAIPNDYKPRKIPGTFDNKYIEYESGSKGKLTVKEYLKNIELYLCKMINNLKTSCELKIYLTIKMNFVPTTGSGECYQMHSKSGNSEIMTGFYTDEIINELFEYLVQRYQVGLEQSIKGSNFESQTCGSCIDSTKWLKNKKTQVQKIKIICFKYALNYENFREYQRLDPT